MKKSISILLTILILFGLTACGKLQPPGDGSMSVCKENGESVPVEESTTTAAEETGPWTQYPQTPGKTVEEFLEEMNATLDLWGVPYILERDPDFYGRQRTKHYFLLRNISGELLPDNTEYYFDAKGAYHNNGYLYRVDFTCFPEASDEIKEIYPQLCAALSVVMDHEITKEVALSIFNMEPSYQGERFTRYQYDTTNKAHSLDKSFDPSAPDVIRLSYSFYNFEYWDVEYTINQETLLNPDCLEYEFDHDPCQEGAFLMRFGNDGGTMVESMMNFYVPYLEDLNIGFLVENQSASEPGNYIFRDKSGTMIYLPQDVFLITERAFGNEAGTRYIRINCNPSALDQDTLKAANSALSTNPQHLFRPAIGMAMLCDSAMSAQEAMDLVMGKIPAKIQEDGTEYLLYCPRNVAFLLKRHPDTGAFEMTIMTRACFEQFFGTLEEYLQNYPILDDPFLEGFD